MKKVFAYVGLLFLIVPLLRGAIRKHRIGVADSSAQLIDSMGGIIAALAQGFLGLAILFFVFKGEDGYKKKSILIITAILGILWSMSPAGWVLGTPVLVFAGERLYRSFRDKSLTTDEEDERK